MLLRDLEAGVPIVTEWTDEWLDRHDNGLVDYQNEDTGGKGSLTQWVHCEFVVSFEAIRPVITQQVCGEFF